MNTIQTLEIKKEEILKRQDMASTAYANFLKATAGIWNDKKEKISKKYWSYNERLKAQVAILREVIYMELKREEVEAEKYYNEWLTDMEEMPF